MAKTAVHPLEQNRVQSSLVLDKFLLPLAACAFALIVSPLLIVLSAEGPDTKTLAGAMAVRYENKVFWPALLALTVIVVFRHRERLSRASFLQTSSASSCIWALPASAFSGPSSRSSPRSDLPSKS